MSKAYTVREVEVSLENGAILRVSIDSLEGVKTLFADLANLDLAVSALESSRHKGTVLKVKEMVDESPLERMETRGGFEKGILSRVVAIKNETPQLMRPSQFRSTTDGVLVLLFAAETGLQQPLVEYERFSGIFTQQNLKSGSPLAMLMSNLRQGGYIDRNAYSDGRKIRLTGKGEAKAIKVLQEVVSESAN